MCEEGTAGDLCQLLHGCQGSTPCLENLPGLGPLFQAPAPGLCRAHMANAAMEMAIDSGDLFSLVTFMFFPEVLLFSVGCVREVF